MARGWDYGESGGGGGEGEGEVLTLSKLANRSASRALWRGGEEGAKGSATGSLAGSEENSPEVCGRKCPRRWKESEDSVLEMVDLLPGQTRHRQTCRHTIYACLCVLQLFFPTTLYSIQ